MSEVISSMVCPICGGREFEDFNKRPLAKCSTCMSFERTRLVWLVLQKLLSDETVFDVAHFAPELGIAQKLHEKCGDRYRAFDYEPSRYRFDFTRVEKVNLCEKISEIATGSLDLVVHNHVLEHVPCNVWRALQRLDSLLKPGGAHVFTLPVVSDYYREDLDPRLSPQERTSRFGQDDHMRMFGRHDVRQMLADTFGSDVHFSNFVNIEPDDLATAGVPTSVLSEVNSHTVFVHIRE